VGGPLGPDPLLVVARTPEFSRQKAQGLANKSALKALQDTRPLSIPAVLGVKTRPMPAVPAKVWLVGAGPGDPGLITARARDVLADAEVVLTDALASPLLLEFCPQAEVRNVGKRFGEDSAAQLAINQQLIELALQGRRVVRLKGGDPLLFARGGEEALALKNAGIKFEIVPGISSPVAASAYAGIPLTHREMSKSVTFITGSDRAGKEWSPEAWQRLATATDTICVLMGMRRIEEITHAILAGGRDPHTPAAVIQWGTRPEQRVVTAELVSLAETVRAAGLKNPAVIVVGEVVRLREELAWFDTKPLFGKTVLLPRPEQQGRVTAETIRERGAEALVLPMIEIGPPPDRAPLVRAVSELSLYDWVVFSSANAIEPFFAELAEQRRDARAFGKARVAVVGPKTGRALERFGIRPDLVAKEFVAEGLVEALLATGGPGRVLVPRALRARDVLPEALRAHGYAVDVVAAYETRPAPAAARAQLHASLTERSIDAILFTSGSTVHETFATLGEAARDLLADVTLASIGPITSQALRDAGFEPHVTAHVSTVEGLLDALEEYFASR